LRAVPLTPGGLPTAGAAAIGSEPTLVILCYFSDKDSTTARTAWDAPMFGPYVVGGRSHRDYYREVSYYVPGVAGLDLPPAAETCGPNNDGIAGWYSINYTDPALGQTFTKHPANVYAPGWEQTAASQYVATGALMAADGDVNFAAFDVNGDGFISASELHIIIILAGYEGSYGNAPAPGVWRHHWSLGVGVVLDGVTLLQWNKGGGYSMLGELDPNAAMIEYGLICHETGHDLGLPDLYDPTKRSEGIGEWGLMGSGDWCNTGTLGDCPCHPDPWCKSFLQWLNPIVVATDQFGVNIPQIETNAVAYQLWSRGTPGLEYFLVENRQRTGYDQGLVRKEAADGLIIWHVNYPKHNMGDNEDEIEKFIDVECADGLAGHIMNADDLDARNNRGDANDPWYVNNDTDFYSTSSPDNRDYRKPDNYNTSVEVRNIGASGNPMTADLLVGRTTFVGTATYTANGQASQFNLAAAQDFMRVYYLGWNCCGNTYVYEQDNQGAWVLRVTWCFNVPRHASFTAGQEVRQTQGQTTGRFKLTSFSLCGAGCDQVGDAGYDVDVYDNGALGLGSPGNGLELGGWNIGFRDGLGNEFDYHPGPSWVFAPDAEGLPLTEFPRRAGGSMGTWNTQLMFQVRPNVYWENMRLRFVVTDVAVPGVLMVTCPYAEHPTQPVPITEPGAYEVPLGWIRPSSPFPATVEIMLAVDPPPMGADFGWDWLDLETMVAPIELLTPADGAILAGQWPTFGWSELYAALDYQVQVDDDETFATPEIDVMVPAPGYTTPVAVADGFYYWRARGNSPGGTSDWAGPARLLIDTQPPEFDWTFWWPDTIFSGPYDVDAEISDTGARVDSVLLCYRVNDGDFTCVRMRSGEAGGAGYEAQVPAAAPDDVIDYYLIAWDFAGNSATAPPGAPGTYHTFQRRTAGVDPGAAPAALELAQARPNPFRTTAEIRYGLPRPGVVSLVVYDMNGRLVRTLMSGRQPAGQGSAIWDGRTDAGRLAPSGVYFCRLEAGGVGLTRKVLFLR
jgi:immune inhibitor A